MAEQLGPKSCTGHWRASKVWLLRLGPTNGYWPSQKLIKLKNFVSVEAPFFFYFVNFNNYRFVVLRAIVVITLLEVVSSSSYYDCLSYGKFSLLLALFKSGDEVKENKNHQEHMFESNNIFSIC